MQTTTPTLNNKLWITKWMLFFITIVIIVRLSILQISLNRSYSEQSRKNFLRTETIAPLRGAICDRNGIALATNRPCTDLYWQGTGGQLTPELQSTVQKISRCIGPVIIDTQLKDIAVAQRRYKKIKIAADLSIEQLSQIAELFPKHPNIALVTHYQRFYPYQTVACHLLGYLGKYDIDPFGKMGLEMIFEQTLRGNPGKKLKTINSFGRNLAEEELEQALPGSDIATTLDFSLQQLLEETFPPDYNGTMLIMDPFDGSILGLISRPHFDPSLFLQPISHEDWSSLQTEQPFLNRALDACYPPGSLFKLVSLTAALEEKVIHPDSTWYCQGYVNFADRKYWCHNRWGHGHISTEQAIAYSCNTLFYDIGKKLSIDTLASYAQQFGLGTRTGILFSEKVGLIPTRAWKLRTKGESWWQGETLSAAIGQSYMLVTPLQIARMISSIFTGYLVTPRILLNTPTTTQPLTISIQTRELLQDSMRMVVKKGTGKRINSSDEFHIYAKTSTAQTSSLDKRSQGRSYQEHGWLTAYFAYKDNQPLTLVVLIEHAGSSRMATDCARTFFKAYKEMINKQ